jgi:hypothetical protein
MPLENAMRNRKLDAYGEDTTMQRLLSTNNSWMVAGAER